MCIFSKLIFLTKMLIVNIVTANYIYADSILENCIDYIRSFPLVYERMWCVCVGMFLLDCAGDKVIKMDKAINLSLERQDP